MKRIKLTQDKYAIVDNSDFDKLNKYKWSANKIGNTYYAVRVKSKKAILMHRYLLGLNDSSVLCDHINRNGLDNRKTNLRISNKSQNAVNSKLNSLNTSGNRGVSYDKYRSKWVVRLRHNGKYLFLGRFENKNDAINKYNITRKEISKDFFNN